MSVNRLIRQSLTAMESFATLPFQLARDIAGQDSSTSGRFIKQASQLSEVMVSMPFKWAREFFQENSNTNPQQRQETKMYSLSNDNPTSNLNDTMQKIANENIAEEELGHG